MTPSAGTREAFAERFALLYAEAGKPPLDRVEQWVLRARRIDERGRPVRVSKQRLSDWRRGRNVPARFSALSATLEVLITEARKARPVPVVEQLYDLAAWRTLWDTALKPAPAAVSEPDPGFCPYRGLASFRPEDADWFFGRERSTSELLSRLNDGADGFVMLVAASGTGKSSLLRAGLLPALEEPGSAVIMNPGATPLAELATHLPDGHRVIIVDQFEEIFTLCDDETERREFIHALHEANAVAVLGMRADFYARCLDYPELADALRSRQMILEAMTSRELRDAVGRPAKAVGLELETGLADLMLRDLGISDGRARYDAGALPMLSHALLATWQRRQSGKLTIAGYRAAGGIQGSVAATAEMAWAQLGPAERSAAKDLLLQLVHVGKETQDTRRRSTREHVLELATNQTAAETALEVLARERLVTLDAGTVEITHEALLHAWPRLRTWIDQDRAGNLARQRLEEDAAAWQEDKQDSSRLLRGARLETGQHVVKAGATTRIAREFVAASTRHKRRATLTRRTGLAVVCVFAIAAVVAALLAVRERDDAQFRQLVSDTDRLQQTDTSLAAQMTLVAYRLRPDDQDVQSRLIALQHTPLAIPLSGHTGAIYDTSFSPDGNLLATAGYDNEVRLWDIRDRSRPTPLGRPLTGHTSWVSTAIFSPNSKVLATAGDDATIRMWDVSDPADPKPLGKPLAPGNGTIYSVAFSPDGSLLATADDDHTARLWDVRDPANPVPLGRPLTGHALAVRSVAFSPDGRLLATTGNDGTVRLWDPATATQLGRPLVGSDKIAHTVVFSPDSHTVAVASEESTVRLWDVTDPLTAKQVGEPLKHEGVWPVAFSPDGQLLASAGSDGTVRVWNTADPAHFTAVGRPLAAASSGTFTVEFSPDSRTLATGGSDTVVRLWSVPSTMTTSPLPGRTRGVYSRDSHLLATASGGDRSLRLLDTSNPAYPVELGRTAAGQTGWVGIPVMSPDERLLALPLGDGTVRLMDIADRAKPVQTSVITVRTRDTGSTAFSPDGSVLVTGSDDESLQLWRIDDPVHPVPLGKPVGGHDGYVLDFKFRPDGKVLATAGADKTVRLWNVENPAGLVPVGRPITGHTGPVQQVEFSPDGRVLATASDDKTIRLWNVTDPAGPISMSRLTGHTQSVKSLTFRPDGKVLASAGADKTMRLWNVENPATAAPIGLPFNADNEATSFVLFSPDGHLLTSMGSDRPARFWDLDIEHAVQRICATTRDVLTPDLWHQYIPQFSYDPPCG
jgi:WD40 repeat protein